MDCDVQLPEEILSMICDELGYANDFDTLYNCARSTASLADAALRNLYERHHYSFAFNQTEDDFRGRETDDRYVGRTPQHYFRKWINLWRSIIMSSLETRATYKPYCRYLRILDFRNLAEMLDSPHFRTNQDILYKSPLTKFKFSQKRGRVTEVDTIATINHIGDLVVPRALRLEEVSGHIRPGYLARWIGETPKLRRTVLFMGDALDQDAGVAIAKHCEQFNNLSIHTWTNADADEVFAKFLDDLKPDTLDYLQFISRNNVARKSFEALNRHSTLKELHLSNLCVDGVKNLDALIGCTAIEVLHLEESGMVELEHFHHDVFTAVVGWLSACHRLRDIAIKGLVDGPSILAAVAIQANVKWAKLSLEGYQVRSHSATSFHRALADQQGLEVLNLKGSGEDVTDGQLTNMVASICCLKNLRELVLKQVSDEFEMTHIANIASSLPKLEELWTSGQELTADILATFTQLPRLKNLTFFAITQFDYDSIQDFIISLNPDTQQGFQLSLLAVDQSYDLSDTRQAALSELIRNQVGGALDFVLDRNIDTEESDSD